ncbi:hemicentin-1-like [Astyanax mexicanus]|uniref:Hemicentin-1-like n=1 Tax=Astyanax mexicanus TaxID=7994 RepID=A0A8T2LLK6_ASTMX|nr:hemicentin-1-like [Astyanax mexicanus]
MNSDLKKDKYVKIACVCVPVVQQGRVRQQVVGQKVLKLTCSSSCSGKCYYRWYRGSQQKTENYLGCSFSTTVWIDSTSSSNKDEYSCSVHNYVNVPPSDCKLGEKQWGVTYTPDSVCALEGSSVDLSCSYKHPGGLTVTESFWLINEQRVDLREDDQYKGRVQYNQTENQNQLYHTVRITDLRVSDAQTYKFRFITDDPGGKYIGSSGVSLSVTGSLKIEVSDTQGGGKLLICSSTCTLTNPTYIWYRNEQPVSEQNGAVLYLRDRTVDAGSYSCAVKEHEEIRSAAVYSPKDTRAVVLPSGERAEGDSVTLTCSSDADPPVLTFNWFKQRPAADESLGTGQNYSITNISSQHSGLYYCTALNQLGQHSSAPARLDVFYPPRPPSLSEFNGFNGSITLVCVSDSNPASSYTWFRKTGSSSEPFRNGSNLTLAAGTAGVFYCLAENRYGSSNSSELLFTSVYNTAAIYAASGVIIVLLLIFIAGILWMRKRSAQSRSRSEGNTGEPLSAPVYETVSDLAMTSGPTGAAPSDDQDEVQYSTVQFKNPRTKKVPLSSTANQKNAVNAEEEVLYSTVVKANTGAPR